MNTIDCYLALFGVQKPFDFFSEDEIDYMKKILLLDIEKPQQSERDEWGNFNEKNLIGSQSPFLDQFVIDRMKLHGKKIESIWPEKKKFAVCLTHDVDRVESYSPKVFKRNIVKRFRNSTDNREKIKLAYDYMKNSIKGLYYYKNSDPIWKYEEWESIENEFNVKSTYFFFVRPNSKDIQLFDCDFDLFDTFLFKDKFITVEKYIGYLHLNGFEIGLHGSFKSAVNCETFQHQKNTIKQIIDHPVISTRQHYLHYSTECTAEIHVKNEILLDSTIGLNKSAGFRVGSAFPYLMETKNGNYCELPLIIMDSSILGNQNLSFEDAKSEIKKIIDQVENVGGCLTVNFHLDYVNNKNYFDLYRYTLEIASSKNAFFGTCQQILNVATDVWNSRGLV